MINYGLRFGGVVVSIVGQECGPINLKICVWPYVSKRRWNRFRYVRFGPEADISEMSLQLFVDGFYQREFGLVQWARYAIAAIEPGLLPTINASSSFTRYRKGNSAVASPDFFLPLTWPQMTSKG